jgi:RNA polymerase sigma-70 factor (ECF subfamily)
VQELQQRGERICPLLQADEDIFCSEGNCNAFDKKTNSCLYIEAIQKLAPLLDEKGSTDSLLFHGYDFMSIYWKHSRQIYYMSYSMLRNREDAEDITQETFIRLCKSIVRIGPHVPIFAWLYRTATNLCLDKLRKEKNYRGVRLDTFTNPSALEQRAVHFAGAVGTDCNIELSENMALLKHLMDSLPPRYSQILVLRICEELPSKEVAEILNITPSAVDTLLFRAKKKFIATYRQLV